MMTPPYHKSSQYSTKVLLEDLKLKFIFRASTTFSADRIPYTFQLKYTIGESKSNYKRMDFVFRTGNTSTTTWTKLEVAAKTDFRMSFLLDKTPDVSTWKAYSYQQMGISIDSLEMSLNS